MKKKTEKTGEKGEEREGRRGYEGIQAIPLRWIYDNRELFRGKKVLELGSGTGLCGMYIGSVIIITSRTPRLIISLIVVTLFLFLARHSVFYVCRANGHVRFGRGA